MGISVECYFLFTVNHFVKIQQTILNNRIGLTYRQIWCSNPYSYNGRSQDADLNILIIYGRKVDHVINFANLLYRTYLAAYQIILSDSF